MSAIVFITFILKYFMRHLGFASLPYANHIKGCQLASKITVSFNTL